MAAASGSDGTSNFNFKLDFGALKQQVAAILKDYKGWIANNPGRASDVESFFKILAYLLPGRIRGNSTVLPELLYSTANVVSFWHDHILRKEQELVTQQIRAERLAPQENRNGNIAGPSNSHSDHELEYIRNVNGHVDPTASRKDRIFKIQVALTILEYFEVFLEVAARKLWGDPGRWMIIFVMQAIKTVLRAALLLYYKVGLIRSPAIPAFDRAKYQPNRPSPEENVVFVLKHSGRVIRKIHASPPMYSRDWNVPEVPLSLDAERELSQEKFMAEIMHLARPMCHLVSLGVCGTSSWKPWLLSLAMDVSSLYLHGSTSNSHKSDQIEMQKRTLALLLYLLRSPFYDRATKQRLISSLEAVGSRIPLLGNILLLIAQAIPQWQSTYSYMWS